MIHYVDLEEDWEKGIRGAYLDYVSELKEKGIIRHAGMSTHNPDIAIKAAKSGLVEMILFSANPAFDLMPPTDNIEYYFSRQRRFLMNSSYCLTAAIYLDYYTDVAERPFLIFCKWRRGMTQRKTTKRKETK